MKKFNGTPNLNGRPKGSNNKTTTELRERFNLLIENNFDKLQKDIDLLEPKDRIKTLLELAKFVIPTLKATELSTGNENEFNPITVTIMQSEEIRLIKEELEKKY